MASSAPARALSFLYPPSSLRLLAVRARGPPPRLHQRRRPLHAAAVRAEQGPSSPQQRYGTANEPPPQFVKKEKEKDKEKKEAAEGKVEGKEKVEEKEKEAAPLQKQQQQQQTQEQPQQQQQQQQQPQQRYGTANEPLPQFAKKEQAAQAQRDEEGKVKVKEAALQQQPQEQQQQSQQQPQPQRYGTANEPPPQFAKKESTAPAPKEEEGKDKEKEAAQKQSQQQPQPEQKKDGAAKSAGEQDAGKLEELEKVKEKKPYIPSSPLLQGLPHVDEAVLPRPDDRSPTVEDDSSTSSIAGYQQPPLGGGPSDGALDAVLRMPSPIESENSSRMRGGGQHPPHLTAPRYVHHFDTYGLVRQLVEKGGFTMPQAVTLMKAVRQSLGDNMEVARDGLVSKSNVENETYLFRAACSELRTEIQNRRATTASESRTERTRLQYEVDILSQLTTQQTGTLKDDLKGMFDDRKMAVRMEQREKDSTIQQLNYKITVQLNSDARSEVESLRWVLTRRAAMALALSAGMILATMRYLVYAREKEAANQVREKKAKKDGVAAGGAPAEGHAKQQMKEGVPPEAGAEALLASESGGREYVSLG